MLQRLQIRNFALISEMDVTFPGGLTVITGETGAGKSIFLEALGLALGKRADSSALRDKKSKCVIEAEFSSASAEIWNYLKENDIDEEDHLILRREISAEGKSRSFLNDSPVSLSILKMISEKLMDIHSQHQTLLLNQSDFQLGMVDAFAGNDQLLKKYKDEFSTLTRTKNELLSLEDEENRSRKETDYLAFLFKELEEANIKSGQLKSLQEESATLENAETIKSQLAQSAALLNEGEINVLQALVACRQKLQQLSKFGKTYEDYFNRLNSSYIELKELSGDLEYAANEVAFDNDRLEEINTAIDKIQKLLKKHNVGSEEELIAIREETGKKLEHLSSLEPAIQKKKKELASLENSCKKIAAELSAQRSKTIPKIEGEVKTILSELSMPHAIFKIVLEEKKELSRDGSDQVKAMFTANKGGDLNELQKVASGGELSRLMLTLKSLLASKKELPTIIFDEIDTGVSGDVANKIGSILHKMGKAMQVITITHLPQIASKGEHHLFVYKNDDDEKTSSFIKELNKDERVTEIAKMLSTGNPGPSAVKNAEEMLSVK